MNHDHESLRAFAQKVRALNLWTLYEQQSFDAKKNAQMNLDGRSHYADDRTLEGFKCRILWSRDEYEGLILGMVESVAVGSDRRGFRPVLFNLGGTVLDRPPLADLCKTRHQADQLYSKNLAGIDPKAVTLAMIRRDADRAERRAASLREMLAAEGAA